MKLLDLLTALFTFNLLTFGNGTVMIPLLQARLVDQQHVLSDDQLLYAFTIARVTPGQANLYVAAIGFMVDGLIGAILAILVVLLPSYLMIPALHSYERVREAKAVAGFTRGLTAASVGVILAATVEIGRRTLNSSIAWIVFPVAFIMVGLLKWHPILTLALACALGVGLSVVLGMP